MKRLIRNTTLSLLGTAMGMFMMAAPLASTVYAAETPSIAINNYDKDQNRDQEHHRDADQYRDEDQRHYIDYYRNIMGDKFFTRRLEMYHDWQIRNQINNYSQNPVDLVMAIADFFGFDANTDTFSLVSQDASQAVVQVLHNGVNYNVTLVPSYHGHWTVSLMSQVH